LHEAFAAAAAIVTANVATEEFAEYEGERLPEFESTADGVRDPELRGGAIRRSSTVCHCVCMEVLRRLSFATILSMLFSLVLSVALVSEGNEGGRGGSPCWRREIWYAAVA